jgi:hypothetical protein
MFRAILLALALLILFGCGGGGGGTPAANLATLSYRTEWVGSTAPTGQSQRVTLFNLNGTPVKSLVMNRTTTPTGQLEFRDLPAGEYRVRAELWSQVDLGGVLTGEVNEWIDLSGLIDFNTITGTPLTTLRVTPANRTFDPPASFAFAGSGINAAGKRVFLAPNSVSWQAFGGVGTINTAGTFLAENAGSGSVRGTHASSGEIASSVLTVNPPQTTRRKWTILVFLNSANDLYASSDLNMNQMERVASNPEVQVIVQWKQTRDKFRASSFDGTRRYKVQPDNTGTIASTMVQDMGQGTDMGRPETLRDFIAWGKKFYPADRYGLVVWNHGNGWRRRPVADVGGPKAVSYDDQTNNAIQTWELQAALQGQKFDFLAWDASLMQMIEVAYEIRAHADFIVGSEESPPAAGYPYDVALGAFTANPEAPTRQLTKSFVDAMINAPAYVNESITQSVLESGKLPALVTAIDGLAGQLLANSTSMTTLIPQVRLDAQSYKQNASPPRYYRDLEDVCARIKAGTTIASVRTACDNVIAAKNAALVWEGHNTNSPGSRGVSIDFTPGNVFLSSSADYARLDFAKNSRWDEWLATAP